MSDEMMSFISLSLGGISAVAMVFVPEMLPQTVLASIAVILLMVISKHIQKEEKP
jgi:hypothetical protein